MKREEFDAIIDKLLDEGIQVTLSKVDDIRVYDLNTGMKSGLAIHFVDDQAVWNGRYEASGNFESYDDLLYVVRDCRYGRPFADAAWERLFKNMDWPLFEEVVHVEKKVI